MPGQSGQRSRAVLPGLPGIGPNTSGMTPVSPLFTKPLPAGSPALGPAPVSIGDPLGGGSPDMSDPNAVASAIMRFVGGSPAIDPSQWYDPNKSPGEDVISPWGVPLDMGPSASPMDKLRESRRKMAELIASAQGQAPIDEAQAQQSGNSAAMDALNSTPVPHRNFAAFTPQPLPIREQPDIPGRDRPRVDPGVGILTGLLGLIAPRGAPGFTAASMRGAIDRANGDYSDKMAAFRNAVEQANQRYGDQSAQVEETNAANLSNLRGGETADYTNASADRAAALAKLPYLSTGASLASKLGTPTQPGSLSRRLDASRSIADAQSDVGDQADAISAGLGRNASMLAAHDKEVEQRTNAAKAVEPLLTTGIKTKADAAELTRKLAEDWSEAQLKAGTEANRAGIDQTRAAAEQQRATSDMLDKGLMIDPKTGQQIHDPNAALYDANKGTAGELQAAARSHTAAQRNSLATFNRLSAAYRKSNPSASGVDVANFVFNSPEYKFARKAEEDAGGRLSDLREQMGENAVAGSASPPPNAAALGAAQVKNGHGMKADLPTAMKFLQMAGGDKNKARALARKQGYVF